MLCEEIFDLLDQTARYCFGHGCEVDGVRRVLREVEQPVLDAGEAVLKAQVERIAFLCL